MADELTGAGGKALAVATHVRDREQVKRLVDTAVKSFGRIAVMLNNAGVMPLGQDATVYCATKHAVRARSVGLRQEVKPYNIRTTVISPGGVATDLLKHISEKAIQAKTREFVSGIAFPAETFARMVAFAINEPADVDVNEILFRPTAQPL